MAEPGGHERWMREALAEAAAGAGKGNLPVGSVVIRDGRPVARGHNEVVSGCDPTAHAEIVAIRRAAAALGTPLLTGCVLYTSLEPCPMCAAALVWARVERVVIGAFFPRTGGVRSRARILDLLGPIIHTVQVDGEVLPAECLAMLPADYR
ncbi:MAG: nucleoside deaminase [Candidatus Rokuibacteriota bacterium]